MSQSVWVGQKWMRLEICCRCKTPFCMTEEVYQMAQQRRGEFEFFCPNGHGQVYAKGETEEQKLRRERDRLKQDATRLIDEANEARRDAETERRRAAAARGQVTKLKKRAAVGVCPCCNRTFSDLARHMAGQHPEFISQPDEASHVH